MRPMPKILFQPTPKSHISTVTWSDQACSLLYSRPRIHLPQYNCCTCVSSLDLHLCSILVGLPSQITYKPSPTETLLNGFLSRRINKHKQARPCEATYHAVSIRLHQFEMGSDQCWFSNATACSFKAFRTTFFRFSFRLKSR